MLFAIIFSLTFVSAETIYSNLGKGMIKHAVAQEGNNEAAPVIDQGDPKAAELAQARLDALMGQIHGIKKNLGQAELTHFGIIYGNYNIYSTVKAVHEDVENAVKGCIENNPEMEDQLSARWDVWTKSVSANMEEAWANINAMTMAQDYAPQENMRRIFNLIDETRKANSSRFEAVPVTTPEACEFMLSKMDETQDNMNMMLIATIKSYSSIMKAMQE
jgi:hypothetical protein